MSDMTDTVRPDSLVTLHYRFLLEDGTAVVSTFEATPATLQLGTGEVLPALERCLAGLRVGERRVFTLPPEEAFGPHRPELVERVARADFPPEVTDAMTRKADEERMRRWPLKRRRQAKKHIGLEANKDGVIGDDQAEKQ